MLLTKTNHKSQYKQQSLYYRVDEHEPIPSSHKGAIKEYRLEISNSHAGNDNFGNNAAVMTILKMLAMTILTMPGMTIVG